MKKTWEAPRVLVQKFIANEYVAACYKIKCTTPNGNSSYRYLYDDTNNNGVWDADDRRIYSGGLGGFSGCGNWHSGVIRDDPPSANGFVTSGTNPNRHRSSAVFWWQESFHDGSVDYHVMTPGDENYETNPNAS